MGIIAVSRGSYSQGKEVAERVAARLNYKIISREDLISSASKEFNIPEVKLLHAIKDAPSFWDRITYFKDRYILYIETAFLNLVMQDNVVYHGFAGHFFLRNIPHVLKVRINAAMDIRAKFVMQRDKLDREEAIKTIKKLDEARKKWSERFYGINTFDPDLYDMVLKVAQMNADEISSIICNAISLEAFIPTPETFKMIEERITSTKIKTALMKIKPDIEVAYREGVVTVKASLPMEANQTRFMEQVKKVCSDIPGVKIEKVEFRISTVPTY